MRTLYRSGTVYSDADLFATALLVDGETITWLGDEAGAEVQQRSVDAVVDLTGALLAPGFVDGGDIGDDGAALRNGILHRVEMGTQARWVGTSDDLAALPPGFVAVLDPRVMPSGVDLSEFAARGVPFAFATATGSPVAPWDILRHALARGLSVRAAFTAYTRGPWRAAAVPRPGGRLHVGAEATFAVWDAAKLVVQVADMERSAWSADVRSGLPGLPALGSIDDSDWHPPQLREAIVQGEKRAE